MTDNHQQFWAMDGWLAAVELSVRKTYILKTDVSIETVAGTGANARFQGLQSA